MYKQYDAAFNKPPYDAIQTDGCFVFDLLYGVEEFSVSSDFTETEIKRIWHYSIPDYLEDHRHPHQDRCFIKAGGHVEIMRVGFYIMGIRNVKIKYKYRIDGDEMIIGRPSDLYACNFFITKCKLPTFSHFYVSDQFGKLLWNPGNSYSEIHTSLRGFEIELE